MEQSDFKVVSDNDGPILFPAILEGRGGKWCKRLIACVFNNPLYLGNI